MQISLSVGCTISPQEGVPQYVQSKKDKGPI